MKKFDSNLIRFFINRAFDLNLKSLYTIFPHLILLYLILGISNLQAASTILPSRTITGVVTDKSDGSPIPGVTVQEKGTSSGSITDMDGKYSIIVTSEHPVLIFKYLGMKTQEIEVKTESVINVALEAEDKTVNEVVVIGYGTVKKKDLTGAVSTLNSDESNKITSLNAEQGLQGKVAGVQVTSTTGAPGAIPVIRIRGVGTFNNTSPIFVVDGVIVDDISFLSSSDIETWNVLKDASSTAIYGSRGANGVILITTKAGKAGQEKPVINFSYEYSVQYLAKKIDLLNGSQYGTVYNLLHPGYYNNVALLPNTDWQSLIFRNAPMQSAQLSFSGSTKLTQYYFGFSYFGQDGIIPKSYYRRLSFKFNDTYNLFSNFRFGNNITVTPYTQENAPDVTNMAYRAQPVYPAYNSDGTYGQVPGVGNPLAAIDYTNSYNTGIRGVGNMFVEANILSSLTAKSSFGIDAAYNKSESFSPAYYVSPTQNNEYSSLNKGSSDNATWLWENTLTFNKEFGKNSINAVAGITMQNSTSEIINVPAQNLIRDDPSFWYLAPSYIQNNNPNINTVQGISDVVDANLYYSMLSYLFRANYTYDNRYILTATFRRDGSSKFSPANRYSNFPSFAAGWNISNEDFMKSYTFISNLKLRTSWGKIGNEKIQYTDRFSQVVMTGVGAVLGTTPAMNAAATLGTSGNPDLKWETTTQYDAGLEAGVLKNRLTGELDYYNRVTDDILLYLTTPGYLGNGVGQQVRFNAGSVLNRGVELKITWRDKIGAVNYSVTMVGSTIHNEVLKMGGISGSDSILMGGALANGQYTTQSRVGLPIGAFFGYKTDGIFQNQNELNAYPHLSTAGIGDMRYVDINGDGKLTAADRTNLGSPIPKYVYGFTFEASYKNFDLSIDIQGQSGNKILNAKEIVRPDPYNYEKHVINYWHGAGTSNTEPLPQDDYNYIPSDRFLQDGSFVRIRNVSLGYTLPKTLSNKYSISQLRFYLKATNVITFTKFTGYTPEIGAGSVIDNGLDNGAYPVTSVISIGVNLTF